MTTVQSILPSNSTAWERAVEQVSAERWPDVDVDIIRRAKSPWECPEHLLPFLAHELSVDLWDDRWDVEKKRRVIARSIDMHRKKGTKTGIFDAVELTAARAEGKKEGASEASARLMTALGAEGVKGDPGRMSAALDLAQKSPGMSGEDVAAFVVANVTAVAGQQAAADYEATRLAAAGLAQPAGGSQPSSGRLTALAKKLKGE